MNIELKKHLIAVGLDDSERSWKAFQEAVHLAQSKKSALHIVSIQEAIEASYSASEVLAAEKTSKERLEMAQVKARLIAEEAGLEVIVAIVKGNSAHALADYAKKHLIDLLITGDTGHSSLWGVLIGTTAEKLVREAPCSVLIVR